ncbi:hypothetical protein B0188_02395 [[Haemophilus] felis]|uniref:Cytolethal distending toxin subunit A n=1 Tax=[Haemophilus] felis TaxID=123822 RepID=A0A1T0B7S3_9PAST|nr:hypothetical protein B0188_02395 [[Haemophilus] felis]
MKKFLLSSVLCLFWNVACSSAADLSAPTETSIAGLGDSPTPPSEQLDVPPVDGFKDENLTNGLDPVVAEDPLSLFEQEAPMVQTFAELAEEPKLLALQAVAPALAPVTQNEVLPTKPPRHFERFKSPNSNYISIMGQDGAVITVWALAKRNWLWGYAPIDSQNFGNIRNWRLERSFSREHFRFVNQQLGSCIQVYKNGLIHDTCDKRRLEQDFLLLPTDTGSVFIKSVATGLCVTYDPVNKNNYDTLTMQKCDEKISPSHDQNFYLAPPILAANPDIQWGN